MRQHNVTAYIAGGDDTLARKSIDHLLLILRLVLASLCPLGTNATTTTATKLFGQTRAEQLDSSRRGPCHFGQ